MREGRREERGAEISALHLEIQHQTVVQSMGFESDD